MNPDTYHREAALRDGSTLRIRAIRPSDREVLLAEFRKLSPSSVRSRFFTVKHDLSPQELDFLTDVDFIDHVAIVGELDAGPGGARPVGVGRFVTTDVAGHAELAITVAEGLHGRGIGTALLSALADVARSRGLRYLDAYVLAENREMIDVLSHSGLSVASKSDRGDDQLISLDLGNL